MNFKSVKKVVSKFVLAMLLSSSFSLSSVAIGPEQEKAMQDWLSMMKLDVKEGMEKLQYTAKNGTPCYLVPIYEDAEIEKFVIDLYSNPEYENYMYNWFGGKRMSTSQRAKTSKYTMAYLNMHHSKDSRVNGNQYFDGLSRSVYFMIYYGDKLAGQISMGPMRDLGIPGQSEIAVVVHKDYSRRGILSGLDKIDVGFFMNAYKNGTKNAGKNLTMMYTSPYKPQAEEFMGKLLIDKFGFHYDEKLTKQNNNGSIYYSKIIK